MSLADTAPSFAVSCRTYAPWTEKLAVVEAAAASPNVTVPGPLTFVHCVVTAATGQAVVGDRAGERGRRGREREDLIGSGIDHGRHVAGAGHDHGDRCRCPSSSPSFAVNVRTYVPARLNDAEVDVAFGVPNVTVPGPLVLVHAYHDRQTADAVIGHDARQRGRGRQHDGLIRPRVDDRGLVQSCR